MLACPGSSIHLNFVLLEACASLNYNETLFKTKKKFNCISRKINLI